MKYVIFIISVIAMLSHSDLLACSVDKDIEEAEKELVEAKKTMEQAWEDYKEECMFANVRKRSGQKVENLCFSCTPGKPFLVSGFDKEPISEARCNSLRCVSARKAMKTGIVLWGWGGTYVSAVDSNLPKNADGSIKTDGWWFWSSVPDGEEGADYRTAGMNRAHKRISKACNENSGSLADSSNILSEVTNICVKSCIEWNLNKDLFEEIIPERIKGFEKLREELCGPREGCEGLTGVLLLECECELRSGYIWDSNSLSCVPSGEGASTTRPKGPPGYDVGDDPSHTDDYPEDLLEETPEGYLDSGLDTSDILSDPSVARDATEGGPDDPRGAGILAESGLDDTTGTTGPGAQRRGIQQRREAAKISFTEEEEREDLEGQHEGISTLDESVFEIVHRMHRTRYFAGLLDDALGAKTEEASERRGPIGTKPIIYERGGGDRTTVR